MKKKDYVIRSVAFVKSASHSDHFPEPTHSEIALVGKSNVGKSSLINHLVHRKGLARTSNTPGRTQLVNFFEVNQNLILVDLPGYGYAKVPEAIRKEWQPLILSYLQGRTPLKGVLFLLDARRTPGDDEIQLLKLFKKQSTPLFFVLTKSDKIAKNKLLQRIKEVAQALGIPVEAILPYSIDQQTCREELWDAISALTSAKG